MSSATQQLTTTTSALVARAKDQWAVVHAQWIALPDTLKAAWEQVRERIQLALELPTKEDLGKLSSRLDELDAKLAALIAAREAPSIGELHVKQTHAEKRTKKR